MELKIDPEFQNLIPPLKEEEFKQLRRNIRVDGCIHPIIVWGSVIIDGHNRYKICTEDPNNQIHFDVQQMDFPSREAAMDWIDRNQTGRRNLSPDDFKLIVGRIYNRTKLPEGRPKEKLGEKRPVKRTSAIIGDEFGIGERSVRDAGKLAAAVEEIQKAEPDLDRPHVIEKAKEMTKRKDHLKTKHKEEKPEETRQDIKNEREIIKPLGHEVAMKYARMAVLQLESIHRNDHDKDEAFDFVIEWINQHR